MSILITLIAVIGLLLLIIGLRWHPFVALMSVAILTGFALGLDVEQVIAATKSGVAGILGDVAVILGLGAGLGGVIAETGAAHVIADRIIGPGGKPGRAVWRIGIVAFLIGIPLFYNAGFVLLAPIVFAVARRAGLPLGMVAVAGVAALSVTHGFLPPHPAPVLIAGQYGADPGRVLLYGILLAIPAVVIAGPLFASFFLRGLPRTAPEGILQIDERPERSPGFGISVLAAMLPVLLIAGGAALRAAGIGIGSTLVSLLNNEIVALLLGLLFAIFALGGAVDRSVAKLMETVGESLRPMAAVILIIAAGGAFKQVLLDSGTSERIVELFRGFNTHPLIVAWVIAAALRITLGSATVAAITAAGIVLPLLSDSTVSPELLVLATGAGSLTCSHVNDTGFWLFKSYFGLSVGQTLKSWTVMETLVSLIGLAGCLLLDLLLG